MEMRIKPADGRQRENSFTSLLEEAGRGYVLAFRYFASAAVSASVAVGGRVAYSYLVDGAESRAGLSAGKMFAHALHFGVVNTGIVLVLGTPVAWLPLSVSLAIMRRIQRNHLVICLISGLVTALILEAWIFAILLSVMPDDGNRSPFWLVLAFNLPFALPAGAIGGLVLWALCYREIASRQVVAADAAIGED